MTHRSRRSTGSARGYTAVELLMSVAILTVGVSGVVAMQKVTVTSNQHAKNLTLATQVAQAWMDQLRADSLSWNHPSSQLAASDLADTVWLDNVEARAGQWFRPAWDGNRQFGAGFDAQGRPVDPDERDVSIRFCTHLRLSYLYQPPPIGTMAGNALMRAEVRVFWLRDGQSNLGGIPICDDAETEAEIGASTERYHFVYNVSAIRQNAFL